MFATTKHWLKRPAVLVVLGAMLIATAGLVYAHWTSTSSIWGQVNTGNIWMGWQNTGTNDDGDPGNDPSGNDDGGGMLFDENWGPGSSDDPSDGLDYTLRYDKDVAGCFAGEEDTNLNWNVEFGYPSYYCHLFTTAYNHGNVPVKATALRLTAEAGFYECTRHFSEDFSDPALPINGDEFGEFIDYDEDGEFDVGVDQRIEYDENGPYADNNDNDVFDVGVDERIYDNCVFFGDPLPVNPTGHPGEFLLGDALTVHIEEGILCGTQVDPGQGIDVHGWMHIEQDATQDTSYQVHLEQDWVNWNEFAEDLSMCTFNGLLP